MQQPENESGHVLVSPLWVFICRIFQVLISLVILALAARLMHDAYLDEEGLALAIAIITWLVCLYVILSEKLPTLNEFYHVVAVIVLDGVMMILWLATFAAVAAKRAQFKFNVRVDGCFDDGSLFNSKTCYKKRDFVKKRDVILFKSGGDMLSAIAGLGALVWLLFIATFVWTLYSFLQGRKAGRFLFDNESAPVQTIAMEPKQDQQAQQQQTLIPPQGVAQPNAQYPPQGQYPQGQYPQDQYPPQSTSPYPPAQSPYQPSTAYSPPPQEPQAYNQYPPQQYQQPQTYHEAPSHDTSSPPPPQQTSY
ncbi:MARVEL domain-containing protein [Trichoderma simmonsii]|uniref:MARVEL domain-containing protein n=1 Tax=Trichoderma simmonsii TaxID=1491479 RepID=A0A8G0LAS0_9HYPO|nr:MARVEL domain-containing protein [Trichoderma simmonsii]